MEHAQLQHFPAGEWISIGPLATLNRSDIGPGEEAGAEEKIGGRTKKMKSRLFCKTCGNAITSEADGIAINGSHEHTFMNPGGFVFRIGCFFDAGGCFLLGVPTGEYTWFPGYTWCCVICSACLSHLGWHYRSEGSGFFGLILDQLARR